MRCWPLAAAALTALVGAIGCRSDRATHPPGSRPDAVTERGAILVAGRRESVALRVVGPKDAGGFDGSMERCAFVPGRVLPSAPAAGCDTPKRYSQRGPSAGDRTSPLRDRGPQDLRASRRSGSMASQRAGLTDLVAAAARIDQVVLHYDVCGTSRRCFEVLHDERGLSCHFLLDADGTLYQTLDLALRARHATVANDRAIGIEIAHVGAYRDASPFAGLYAKGPKGFELTLPARLHPPPGGPFKVARDGYLRGRVNGESLVQPDFTEAQYRTLERLLPELCRILPRIEPRVPRRADGSVPKDALSAAELARFHGVLGHEHVQRDKTDPGPAFDWERIARALSGARP